MEAGGGTKHQLFGNFLAFSESLHYLGPEKPLGARKSPKVAKWVTLTRGFKKFRQTLFAYRSNPSAFYEAPGP